MNDEQRYAEYRRLRQAKEQAIFDGMVTSLQSMRATMACAVIEDPALAGSGADVGDWQAGDVGAVTLVYPTLEQAMEYERSPW